ncbi:hypothetical protein, partial [Chryseobacterium sp. SIMBA_029]
HGRAMDVSHQLFAELVAASHGRILVQERINWGGDVCTDCMSLFCNEDAYDGVDATVIENRDFMAEGNNIRKYQSPYSLIARGG